MYVRDLISESPSFVMFPAHGMPVGRLWVRLSFPLSWSSTGIMKVIK